MMIKVYGCVPSNMLRRRRMIFFAVFHDIRAKLSFFSWDQDGRSCLIFKFLLLLIPDHGASFTNTLADFDKDRLVLAERRAYGHADKHNIIITDQTQLFKKNVKRLFESS
jgi:hypothetical protein